MNSDYWIHDHVQQKMTNPSPATPAAFLALRRVGVRLFAFVLLGLLAAVLPAASQSRAPEKKRVLILHSYHQGNQWTDDENTGILSVIGVNRPGFQVEIEYMDTKKIADDRYFEQLVDIYSRKYSTIHFDAILATDDNAFFFLRSHRDRLFPGTPVVFCGVNFFKPSYLEGVKGFTGVNEDADLKGAIDTALMLHPDTQEMVLITDFTETGQKISERFRELIPQYGNRVSFRLLDNLKIEEIQGIVAGLQPGSLVLFTFFFRDSAGVFYDYYESSELITGKARVPVYVAWNYSMGHAVGGLMVNGFDQGRVAGEFAQRILNGEPVDSIPVVMESPNRFVFDFKQMERFGIKASNLPKGSTIINEPSSIYEINKVTARSLVGGIGVIGIAMAMLLLNVRRRRKAEAAFRASEKNYHTLVNNLRVGVYRSSGDLRMGHYLEANPAMLSIFGFDSSDEFMQVPAADLYLNPKERSVFFDEVLAQGFVKDREIVMKRKDGSPVIVSCTTTAHYDHDGKIQWLDGAMEDVTAQKSLEDKLRQSQKMEAIGTLAGGVAHDFNNILTAMMGYAELIRNKTDEDDPRHRFVNNILISAEKAASLIKGLLAFSRKQVISPIPVDLNLIIRNIETLLRRIVGDDIEVVTDLFDEPLTVFADFHQMEQVLMNLVSNARDAMLHGGTLTISTRRVGSLPDQPASSGAAVTDSMALLQVTDTGIGMDQGTQQKIFEPFFTTKGSGRGTGLGLSMIFGTVRQHGGEIKVFSEINKGSIFSVYLPITSDVPKDPFFESSVVRPAMGGKETILVAEDNPEVRNLVVNILSSSGYRVIEAVDGEEAVQQFAVRGAEIDLVLTDMIMPKLSGKGAIEAIKVLKPKIKVLYISGYTDEVIHKHGIRDEAVNFISKPLSGSDLLLKIRSILDSAGG
jgi:two-component system, cell cycle sensor histidine kinase and response regulator CckA